MDRAMWVIAKYKPVSLFSFRSGVVTSSGAKTLFLPTPFAIRTALIDVVIRTHGLTAVEEAMVWIKELSIAVYPPERVVVSNVFAKCLKPTREDNTDKEGDKSAMTSSISFREYAQLDGVLSLALGVAEAHIVELENLLVRVNYFGKRGSFFQLIDKPDVASNLPSEFISLDGIFLEGASVKGKLPEQFQLGLIQIMDDWGETLTFSKLNIYAEEELKKGRDRVRKSVVLPYRLERTSRGFSFYRRF